jgi:hypothetical protein
MTSSLAAVPADTELELAFALQRTPGAYALLVGAGVSTGSGVPSARDVQAALIREIAAVSGERPADPIGWWRDRTGAEPRYDDLLERIAPSPAERQAVLRGFFEPTDDERAAGEKVPSEAHRAIARLVAAGRVRIVVTLNFDHLVETALRDAGVTPTVASTPAEFAALLPLHAQRALVVHLHGDWTDPASMRNTAAELAGYDPRARDLMARIAADHGLVCAGWSAAWDPALREVIAANPNRFFTSWFVDPAPLGPEAERLRALRGALVIRDTAGAALGRLADSTDAIAATSARHPRSAAVAVASAKRALQGGTRAIALHDELRAEVDRTLEHAPCADAPLPARLPVLEESTRVLLALVAVTAYWGTAATDTWWIGEIPRLADRKDAGLASAPAAMVLWAGGTAAVAAHRLDLAHDLLTTLTLESGGQGYVGAAEALALDRSLPFAGAGAWLAGVLRGPLADSVGLGPRGADDAWDRFTYLQTLERVFARLDDRVVDRLRPLAARAWEAHPWGPGLVPAGTGAEEAALRRAIAAEALDELPAPHLRLGGYGSRRYPRTSAALRRELNLLDARHPLVLAGFADGDPGALRVAVSVTDAVIGAAVRRLPVGDAA